MSSHSVAESYVMLYFSVWYLIFILILKDCADLYFHCMSLSCIFFQTSRPFFLSDTADVHFPLCHTFLFLNLSDNFDVFPRLALNYWQFTQGFKNTGKKYKVMKNVKQKPRPHPWRFSYTGRRALTGRMCEVWLHCWLRTSALNSQWSLA